MSHSHHAFGKRGPCSRGFGAFLAIFLPVMAILGSAILPARGYAQECTPCVTLDASELVPSICAGDSARVLLRATNCGNVTGSVLITGPGGLEQVCPSLAPGEFCEFTHVFKTESECPREGEFVFQYNAELRTTACDAVAHDDGWAKFFCCTPRIEVEKTCPEEITFGDEIVYHITVRVPEGSCALENVVARDTVFIPTGIASSIQFDPEPQSFAGGVPIFTFYFGSMEPGDEGTATITGVLAGDCVEDIRLDNHVGAVGTCGAAEASSWDNCVTIVHCKKDCVPCVVLDATEENPQICAGDEAVVLLKATNCGTEKGRIVITGPNDFEYVCESVDPGATCETSHKIETPKDCGENGEFLFEYRAVLTIDGCDQKAEDPGFAKFFCCKPEIHIEKRCPEQVDNGQTFPYGILVTIPEGACGLEKVVVTDKLCGGVVYSDNANIPPSEAPPVGETGTLVWNLGPLTPGSEVVITFDVTAKADCPTAEPCENVATVEGSCGKAKVSDADSCETKIVCKPDCEPCIVLDAKEENPQICSGDSATVILTATNCGTEKGRIVITGPREFEYVCESVDPGQTCETTHTFKTPERCPDDGVLVLEYHGVLSIDGCDRKAEDPGFAKFFCCTPRINVEKRCPEQAENGKTFTYGIRVTIPEGACDLEKVVLTDKLCAGVVYSDNASIPPSEAPPVGETGTLVWNLGPLTSGSEVVITFDVTAKVDCPSDVPCVNEVTVEGQCGNARVSDTDSCETKIICIEKLGACPRTVGFWMQQCDCEAGEGGNVKFSCDEMDLITQCVDDNAQIFDWADSFDGFCAVINPPKPMSKREQAKRQFAAFVANYCAGILPVTANNGDLINLGLDVPITGCAFATTVGGLLDYADDQLVALEAGDEDNDAYTGFKDCLDHVNSHIGIPFDPKVCAGGKSMTAYLQRLEEEAAHGGGSGGRDVNTVTGLEPGGVSDELMRPVPNPFSKTTSMAYAVGAASGEQVDIAIYNTSGQRVRGLVSEFKGAGRYSVTWDGRNDTGASVPAGVYFYRVAIGASNTVTRVVFVK